MDALLQQVMDEYTEGQSFLEKRKQRWVNQLVLYNNLQRGDERIASDMLPTFFNRVFSNLYDDQMQVGFLPAEDGDYKKVEALRKLSTHDYQEMEKAMLDYDWLWDACWFSRGYIETMDFDLDRKLLVPSIVNPLVMTYDPYFADPQQWRFYDMWMAKSGSEMKKLMKDGVVKDLKTLDEIASGIEGKLWDYKVRRDAAKQGTPQSNDTMAKNKLYQILKHFTYDATGAKVMVWTDKNFSRILRKETLDLRDGADDGSKWPVVMKEILREPHSSMSVSVPDLVEDKHRALNVVYNLLYMAAKDEANPIVAYDKNKVVDVTQLFQRQILEHVAVDGDPNAAFAPIHRNPAVSASLLQFIGILKNEAGDVIGTTQTNPVGGTKGKQTATQSAILQQIAELTTSLQSKVISMSEKEFWSHWYQRYLRFAPEGDVKIVRVSTVSGVTFETIRLEDIKTKYPPKVEVVGSKQAEHKELVMRRDLQAQLEVLQEVLDPRGMKEFLKHVYLPKLDMDSATLDAVMPKSLDEIKAEQENEMLEYDHMARIDPNEDHVEHIYVHLRARNTPAKWAHLLAHEAALADQKAREKVMEAAAAMQPQDAGQPEKPKNGPKTKKPTAEVEAAAPLAKAVEATAPKALAT